ncbi:DHA2 family efflux MFS transporter permease subunit [Streptomyces sp. CA-181903]|uniref:DHA2 family efflux MFS transporter permease subunit n=1 Tax=Streptomyces sp. CA-181903 TaxID=3240055 RepID=UPI003D8E674E
MRLSRASGSRLTVGGSAIASPLSPRYFRLTAHSSVKVAMATSSITEQPAGAPTHQRRDRRRTLAAATICAGILISTLDLTIVNVAFPAIGADFTDASVADLSWILNGYAIVFAALLIPAGRFADRFGMKNVFMTGLGLFTVASGLCAVAGSVDALNAARLLQAVGAAALGPTSMGLLMVTYGAEQRAKAMRVWATASGVAAASGPLVGGVLVNVDWPWIFLVNLPIGVLAVIVGARVIAPGRHPSKERQPMPDLFGSALLAVAIGLLALGIVKAPDWGWGTGKVLGALVGSMILIAVLLFRSSRHTSPVIDLSLLRIRDFSMANVASAFYYVAFAAGVLSVSLWCQNVWGWSALATGMAMAPGNLMLPFLSILSAKLVAKLGQVLSVVFGSTVLAIGSAWWAVAVTVEPNYVWGMLPGVLLTRIGMGLSLAPLMGASTRELPATAVATGSGLNNMFRQVGFVLGVSLLIVIIGNPSDSEAALTAYRAGWWFTAAASLAASLTILALRIDRPKKNA